MNLPVRWSMATTQINSFKIISHSYEVYAICVDGINCKSFEIKMNCTKYDLWQMQMYRFAYLILRKFSSTKMNWAFTDYGMFEHCLSFKILTVSVNSKEFYMKNSPLNTRIDAFEVHYTLDSCSACVPHLSSECSSYIQLKHSTCFCSKNKSDIFHRIAYSWKLHTVCGSNMKRAKSTKDACETCTYCSFFKFKLIFNRSPQKRLHFDALDFQYNIHNNLHKQ